MKNWKTTVIGAIAGGLLAIQPLFATGEIDWPQVAAGFAIAVFGFLAKDFNKTGV